MTGKRATPIQRFNALTLEQREAEYARFEKPLPLGPDGLPGKPLNAAQRRRWTRIRRGAGRPRVGRGSKVVPVTIERGLLSEADAFAKAHGMKRSQMVASGLRMVMAKPV